MSFRMLCQIGCQRHEHGDWKVSLRVTARAGNPCWLLQTALRLKCFRVVRVRNVVDQACLLVDIIVQ